MMENNNEEPIESRFYCWSVSLKACYLEHTRKTKEVSWERISINTCQFVHQNDDMQKKDTPHKTKALYNTDLPSKKGIKTGMNRCALNINYSCFL